MIAYPSGTPSWVDLSSPDPDASRRFYGSLFGWERAGTFTKGGAEVAGLSPGKPPVWTTYIAVDDVAAVKSRIEAAGGATVTNGSASAVFTDAEGACFAVWQSDRHRGAQVVNAPGALTMNELRTRDLDRASSFYGEVLGWEVVPIEQGGEVVYASVKLEGRLIAGMLPLEATHPHWIPYFGAHDVEATAAKTQELGGEALSGPVVVPAGRFVALRDQHGAAFMVLEGEYDPPPGA